MAEMTFGKWFLKFLRSYLCALRSVFGHFPDPDVLGVTLAKCTLLLFIAIGTMAFLLAVTFVYSNWYYGISVSCSFPNTLQHRSFKMIPIGLNTGKAAMDYCGGPDKYYARLKGAYNVSRIMGRMNDEDIKALKECQGPALDNGIKLLPVLLFPDAWFEWNKTFMAAKYPNIVDFWQYGAQEFSNRACEMLSNIDHDNLFAVELLNEVQFNSSMRFLFIQEIFSLIKTAYPNVPMTVSRPFPYWTPYEFDAKATSFMDIVTFHTYGTNALEWYVSPISNEHKRLTARLSNVERVCKAIAEICQGKPFLCTEDPMLPAKGWLEDFFAKIFRLPTSVDFDTHYEAVSRAYIKCGAMGPGMPWPNYLGGDMTDGFVRVARNIMKEFIDLD